MHEVYAYTHTHTHTHAVLRLVIQCSTLGPHGLQPARFLCPWRFPGKNTESVFPCPPPGDLLNPGMEEPRSSTLQVDSLPTEPPGKPKITGVGNLSLLQGIFLTQDSNQSLLYCMWILYQLSYQGSPYICTYIYTHMYIWWLSGKDTSCQCSRHGFI